MLTTAATPIETFEVLDCPTQYPPESIAAHSEGTTVVALIVGGRGLPVSCKVVQSSGDPRLDEASCRAMDCAAYQRAFAHLPPKPQAIEKRVRWKIDDSPTEAEQPAASR